ncbi:hypothetical protein SERLA73DRAFT_186633 [Serpula lacrymans var. lacrymans S7.3]|uniref:adenosine deaminase n=2 Tax=Serpula lacrymans var. lacrymans TaxID=341189 RepID=F8Q7L8_SERL3|nr:uncharacterized protein SERLADRAFT_475782 [Serpula lacrymans var. lacrymans S7.9]EGN95556.1 hypothetical protein SERLA73DRAFT_186633 [Serpula lacrymans var. lacrymans S7.3]EGO21084.1 hypothetical protein SERLADRAFT_475782 [Serpula lacrymans var. lacrymans S7.9]
MLSNSIDIAGYERSRVQLIDEDRALRVDHPRTVKFTAAEIEADRIVRNIRSLETQSIWGADHEDIPHVFPGMEFLTAKDIIVKTKLFQILTRMPKGALLHIHQGASVDASVMLRLALQQPAIHISCPNVINASTILSTSPRFKAFPEDRYFDAYGLTELSYIPNTWVSVQKARENFDSALGGPEGFDRWVVGAMTINPTEAYGSHNTVKKIWQKFGDAFMVLDPLIRFLPIWAEHLRAFLLACIDDGISYTEIRTNTFAKCTSFDPAYTYEIAADGQSSVSRRELFLIFDKVVNDIRSEMKVQGRGDEFIGAKIIYVLQRFVDNKALDAELEQCLSMKLEFPHLIVGFDLVGDEEAHKPLIDYLEPLLRFKQRQQELGVDIPFFFHAGETLGDGSKADMNLYDAILLGTKRIGHGFSLVKHPKLMEICREKRIALEVCPISNEVLRLTSSMPMHPLPIFMNNGIPVVLCSDDPGIFGNMGLSFDFFQVLVSSEVTGLLTLGQMARDSIECSTLVGEEKQRAMLAWERRWAMFIKEIVQMEAEYLN